MVYILNTRSHKHKTFRLLLFNARIKINVPNRKAGTTGCARRNWSLIPFPSYKQVYLLFFNGSTAPLGPLSLIFSFIIILQTVGIIGREISSSQSLSLNTGQHKHRINTYTYQTSMHCVEVETTIPPSEWPKTVHALDFSATLSSSILMSDNMILEHPNKSFPHKVKLIAFQLHIHVVQQAKCDAEM
jgi:hypothetical protein